MLYECISLTNLCSGCKVITEIDNFMTLQNHRDFLLMIKYLRFHVVRDLLEEFVWLSFTWSSYVTLHGCVYYKSDFCKPVSFQVGNFYRIVLMKSLHVSGFFPNK